MGIGPNWTPEDIDYLKDHWGSSSVTTIAENLHRSVVAINIKKNQLGLGAFLDNGDYITVNQLFQALGRTHSGGYTLTSWVKNRGLPVKQKTVQNCRFRVIYLTDFWKWAEKNRTFIDFSKVPEDSLGKEPKWVKHQRLTDIHTKQKFKATPWTQADDELLKTLLKQFRYSYMDLSRRLQRTNGAIQRRICDLGLKERPVKADNHHPWSTAEYNRLGEMIKHGMSYELMSEALGRSSKAIRGRVYREFHTENLDKVISILKG